MGLVNRLCQQKGGSRKIKTRWFYQILLFRRSPVTMEERILVASWEWKPDCSGLKSEWAVRKRRQQTWTPFREIWVRGGGMSFIPLKGHLPSPGESWQRDFGKCGG